MIYDDDPELYDAQYLSYRDDIPFYLRLVDDHGGPVLELGAGTGRVTESVARAGHDVVAVDLSAAMLARATRRLAAAGLSERVELLQADMRELALSRRFPVVIAPFNTLMHAYRLDDQDRVLEVVKAHLQPAGVFAFDLYVPRFGPLGVMRHEPSLLEPAAAEMLGVARADLFLSQHDDPRNQLVTSTYFLDTVAADGTLKRTVSELRQRYFTRFELERALRAAGFALSLYGGFDRSRYEASSTHLVGIARLLS